MTKRPSLKAQLADARDNLAKLEYALNERCAFIVQILADKAQFIARDEERKQVIRDLARKVEALESEAASLTRDLTAARSDVEASKLNILDAEKRTRGIEEDNVVLTSSFQRACRERDGLMTAVTLMSGEIDLLRSQR